MKNSFAFESLGSAVLAFCASAGLADSRHCKWLAVLVKREEGDINLPELYDRSLDLAVEEEAEEGSDPMMTPITIWREGAAEGLRWVTGNSETEITLCIKPPAVEVKNNHDRPFRSEKDGQMTDPLRSFEERVKAVEHSIWDFKFRKMFAAGGDVNIASLQELKGGKFPIDVLGVNLTQNPANHPGGRRFNSQEEVASFISEQDERRPCFWISMSRR